MTPYHDHRARHEADVLWSLLSLEGDSRQGRESPSGLFWGLARNTGLHRSGLVRDEEQRSAPRAGCLAKAAGTARLVCAACPDGGSATAALAPEGRRSGPLHLRRPQGTAGERISEGRSVRPASAAGGIARHGALDARLGPNIHSSREPEEGPRKLADGDTRAEIIGSPVKPSKPGL